MSFYDQGEFMKRRIQLINSAGVLRVRELRIKARSLFPCVDKAMMETYCDAMDNAKQIAISLVYLLDMFDVEPLECVSQPNTTEPKGVA